MALPFQTRRGGAEPPLQFKASYKVFDAEL
jgi:hypothetical protein